MNSILRRTGSLMMALLAITTLLTAVVCIWAGHVMQFILLFVVAFVLAAFAKLLVDM